MDTRTHLHERGADLSERELAGLSVSISDLVERISGFLRRRYMIFAIVTGLATGIGLVYLLTAPAEYTAHAVLMIDSSKLRALQPSPADVPLDTAQVESQVELLKSDKVAKSVVRDLHLMDDPEFVRAGLWRPLLTPSIWLFGGDDMRGPDHSEDERIAVALDSFLRRRAITRVGRSYALDVAFTSRRPAQAAEIANAIVEAYIVDQLDAKYEATRRASKWLEERMTELRTQATAVDRAVLDYKQNNNIVDIGIASSPGGASTSMRALEEQQLGDLASQLSAARMASSDAKTRVDRIQEILKQDIPDAGVAESIKSEVVIRLRNQYLDLAAREGLLSTRYGNDHQATINLREQMYQIRQSIGAELRRIAESNTSDYEIAKAREETLKTKLADMVSDARTTSRERIGLRELETNAQAYHSIYDNFLTRYMEAIQQQSFPITEARLVSPANPRAPKSGPKTFSVLGGSILVGLWLSVIVAVAWEVLDRVFRTTRQVHEILQTSCLAVVPRLMHGVQPHPRRRWRMSWPKAAEAGNHPPPRRGEFFRFVVFAPLSPFANAIRSIKVAADIGRRGQPCKVIGVTSTYAAEGKSTVASNLAELIAQAGKKVILIDIDVRNPSLSRVAGAQEGNGLLEVLDGTVELDDAVRTDATTGLAFLPAVVGSPLAPSREVLASESFRMLIARLREQFDTIIVDLPPLGPVTEVRASASLVDSYVYVIEWGRTSLVAVRQQMLAAPEVHDRLLGAVLNKVDMNAFRRHEHHVVGYYAQPDYAH
ncbi:polysaccharide biosynthesis tyrosine autokinase [Bradyrhizobium sp. CCGUVB4N]|uniref:polysaccharide biosynthesis tyrosine autokinase n=1 Tax=Bradyrhizobium sp. CCGUVB4N TaxID=2949631 RepID=UPI0020B4088A|nr:polysaccharide biosynthesis tyrosine autokinase [Bradyrhizobium sp. CCGUVB4N]MCP3384035.1 polysaccharide biosynthesis tyrosine autokinase [Bradyrhizobium sp. CCGUVB4N]